MCYNCGCGMPNNDMGKPKNITNLTFGEAAKAMGQDPMDRQGKCACAVGKGPRRQGRESEQELEAVTEHSASNECHRP